VYSIEDIDFSYLHGKKVLLLSDTGFAYPYIIQFLKKLKNSEIYIYICPATTSRFVKLWIKTTTNKSAQIIRDKHYKMFFTNEIDKYEVIMLFGKSKNPDRSLLRKILRNMLLSYQRITVVTEKGIDCDENYTLVR
jgi:soluble P-type ATPase